MNFKLFSLILAISLTMPIFGCVSIKTHVADRARVDQELPAGADELYPNRAKTRQVVVVEVAPKVKAGADSGKAVQAAPVSADASSSQDKVAAESKETAVAEDSHVPSLPTVEQYTIQKDDTLQKISKKLYGTFGKWTIIYEANRDVIKDPNSLKPGKILKIPVIEQNIEK